MQIKKDDIKDKLISSARREFLDHGYAKASLRVIAEKAGLTKGAIYSYFENKDALFCALTAPAVHFIENEFQYDRSCYAAITKENHSDSFESNIQGFRNYAHEVLDHYESFKLLLFCSAGSSLQDYKERIIQLYAQNFQTRLSLYTKTKKREDIISEMFVHTLAGTYVSFLEELVVHEPNRKEADDYAVQMAIFVQSGIEKLYSHQSLRLLYKAEQRELLQD